MPFALRLVQTLSLPGLMLALGTGARAEEVRFDRDILPILSDTCFTCHGPDEKARKSAYRLDQEQIAFRGGESGETAIVPGDPSASQTQGNQR